VEFAEYIRSLREQQNLTLRQVEEKTGISNSYLSQMENGRRVPSPEYVGKLASAYGVPVGDLLKHTERYKPFESDIWRKDYSFEVDETYKQIMKQDSEDNRTLPFEDVPSQVKTQLVKYAWASGFGHFRVEPRLSVRLNHSHLPIYASIELPDHNASGAFLVNRQAALKLIMKPHVYMFGVTDEAVEEFFDSQSLKAVKVNGQLYFDLMDVLQLQGKFPELVGSPAFESASAPPQKTHKSHRKPKTARSKK
jgi:transcriptional regulator with XRE-family HTH domain